MTFEFDQARRAKFPKPGVSPSSTATTRAVSMLEKFGLNPVLLKRLEMSRWKSWMNKLKLWLIKSFQLKQTKKAFPRWQISVRNLVSKKLDLVLGLGLNIFVILWHFWIWVSYCFDLLVSELVPSKGGDILKVFSNLASFSFVFVFSNNSRKIHWPAGFELQLSE